MSGARFMRYMLLIFIGSCAPRTAWSQGNPSGGMTFGGMGAHEIKSSVEEDRKMTQEQLRELRERDEQRKKAHYQKMDQVIEKHVKSQRTSEDLRREGKAKDDNTLYVRMLEFHDHDGDGLVDHGVSGESSELERAFAPDSLFKGKKLDIYKYFEVRKFKNADGELIRHMRRKMEQEKEKKAREVGKHYADEVINSITDEGGSVMTDLAEDTIRDLREKVKENAQEAMHFQRIKRLEKYMSIKQKEREAEIKAAFEVKKDQAESEYESFEDRRKNIEKFEELLTQYKKEHPECLKTQWNCYVGDDGVIRVERITDTKRVGRQVGDTQEYEAQAQALAIEQGDAFIKRLPGEKEEMSVEMQRKLEASRKAFKERKTLLRKIIEKKRRLKAQGGKAVVVEEDTGRRLTEEELRKLDQPSAFRDRSAAGEKGEIDPEKLKEHKGEGVFKTLEY